MAAARFTPTLIQSLARGLYLGVVAAAAVGALLVAGALAGSDPGGWWVALVLGPPVGVVWGLALRRDGIEVDAGGIRSVAPFGRRVQPWSRVVDLRAERRGNRTVVSVYLDCGTRVRLRAPYSGELFAADPRFELKVAALGELWRSHRFGGVPG